MRRRLALLALASGLCACGDGDPVPVPPDAGRHFEIEASLAPLPELDAQVDDAEAAEEAAAEAALPPALPGLARNVIVFMGDGMGPEQLSTARYVKPRLRIDEMDGPGFANTDSLSTLNAEDPELVPTDSAAGATAIATGARVINGALSLSEAGQPLETVLEVCQRRGKATGLVTTSYFFDASPAAFSVHQAARGDYDPILRQMLGETRPDVIMGHDLNAFDPALSYLELARANGYALLRGVAELAAWDPRAQPRVIGVFATDFVSALAGADTFLMTPALERRPDSPDPTLATMTARALERLAHDPDGFFLFAEDELLDVMGHRGPAEVAWANRAYPRQTAALDDAVGVAIDWVRAHSSFEETLIVLLADHETGGYQYDRARGPESGTFSGYSEGDSYRSGNHTRRPTAVYALGPGSAAVTGVREHADTHLLLLGELPVSSDRR